MSNPPIDKGALAQTIGSEGAQLKSVDWSPVGTGQVAASYRGKLVWETGNGPDTIVVKCPSENPTSRQTGIEYGLYEKEVNWYLNLLDKTQVNCPKHYSSRYDHDSGDFLIVMGDCAQASQGDQIAGGTPEQVYAGLAEMAHLHAGFFDDETITKNEVTFRDPDYSQLRVGLFANFWPEFRERYTGRLDANILEMGDDLAPKFETFEFRPAKHFSMVHNDYRLDNILYPDAGGRAFILDWQTVAENCPMKDVAYFVGTSFATPELRQAHEAELLNNYFDGLKAHNLNFDEDYLRREYRVQALSGFVMAVISSMLVERTERGDEMFALMAERPGYQALEMDSVSLV